MDDSEEFAGIVGAMKVLLFEEDEMQNIWELIACVLHLGNLVFGGRCLLNSSYLDFCLQKRRNIIYQFHSLKHKTL